MISVDTQIHMLGFMDKKSDTAKIDLHWNAIRRKLLHLDKTLGTPFEKYIKHFTFARHHLKGGLKQFPAAPQLCLINATTLLQLTQPLWY